MKETPLEKKEKGWDVLIQKCIIIIMAFNYKAPTLEALHLKNYG